MSSDSISYICELYIANSNIFSVTDGLYYIFALKNGYRKVERQVQHVNFSVQKKKEL